MMETENFIGPVNLGNPREFTILDLAKKIIAMTGSRSQIVQKPLPSDDPTQRQPNIALAKQKLGWEPKVGVDQGFATTIEYFKKELDR
jgi:UDP-glucuronate decarboxylase